jgi:DNA-binding transcriptional MerR regulator
MPRVYRTDEVAKMIGITPTTVADWETKGFIPKATRVGLRRKRVWSQAKVELILGFARDNGYIVKPLEGVQHG